MSDYTLNGVNDSKEVYMPFKHDDEIKELARQVWAWEAGRDGAKTARLVSQRTGQEVTPRSIQRWVIENEWVQRASDDLRSLAPGLREAAASELIAGSLEAARYLRDVIRSDEVTPDMKVKVTAAQLILDRAGFSPVGSRDPVAQPIRQQDTKRGVMRWLSDDDIKAIEGGG